MNEHEDDPLHYVLMHKSYVASITLDGPRVTLHCEVLLDPGHPGYRPATSANILPYRRARIIFEGIGKRRIEIAKDAIELDSEGGWSVGDLYHLHHKDGVYRMDSGCLMLEIEAKGLLVEIDD